MLTRRENLLIRPWQDLRYLNHRKKVKAALPAIDNGPPPYRHHVCFKLKKSQKEAERCSQIMADNFTLLQHLSKIMSTTRINNAWDDPPPNFLNRVGIYARTKKESKSERSRTVVEELRPEPKTRKDRCYGCSPHPYPSQDQNQEDRVPFEIPKKTVSRRKSLFNDETITSKSDFLKSNVTRKKEIEEMQSKKINTCFMTSNNVRQKKEVPPGVQDITLTHEDLTVKLSFPSKTEVEYTKAGVKKVIQKEFCECRAIPRLRRRISKK